MNDSTPARDHLPGATNPMTPNWKRHTWLALLCGGLAPALTGVVIAWLWAVISVPLHQHLIDPMALLWLTFTGAVVGLIMGSFAGLAVALVLISRVHRGRRTKRGVVVAVAAVAATVPLICVDLFVDGSIPRAGLIGLLVVVSCCAALVAVAALKLRERLGISCYIRP